MRAAAALPIAELRNHVRDLCETHGLEVQGLTRRGAWAQRKTRRVSIPAVQCDVSYAVALHEIGHIVGPHQSGRRLEQEWGAWIYAERVALVWTDAMEQRRASALKSYLIRYTWKHNAWLPPAEHAIWSLAGITPDAVFGDTARRLLLAVDDCRRAGDGRFVYHSRVAQCLRRGRDYLPAEVVTALEGALRSPWVRKVWAKKRRARRRR